MNAHADRKIFVHCAANMRVSAFMYLYRQIEDTRSVQLCPRVDRATAKLDLVKIWLPNEIWQNFIDRVRG